VGWGGVVGEGGGGMEKIWVRSKIWAEKILVEKFAGV
jgi:hypothetical protein